MRWLLAVVFVLAGMGCSDDTSPADAGVDAPSPTPDSSFDAAVPDQAPQLDGPVPTIKVAAVQLSKESYTKDPACEGKHYTCPLAVLVQDAVRQGAKMVVTPDYATYVSLLVLASAESEPAVGDTPASTAKWGSQTVLHNLAKLAKTEKVWLTFTVETQKSGAAKPRHTTVAVDPQGVVRGVHHKYMLFDQEATTFTPGDSLAQSFFDSPLGKTGLMSTAEAQCFVKKGVVSKSCTAAASVMYKDYLAQKPDAVFYSAWWFGGAGIWDGPSVMKTVATQLSAWLVVANGTKAPNGNVGGVWAPDGSEHQVKRTTAATVIIDDVPTKGTWTPPDAGLPVDAAPDTAPTDAGVVEGGAGDGAAADAT